jgi:hypothetical protein
LGHFDTLSGFLWRKAGFWGGFHSFILPCSVSLKEALSL